MENGTDGNVSNGKLGYFEALKVVALPLGSVIGVLGLVFYFAAGAWVQGIVRTEIALTVAAAGLNENTLIAHTGKIAQHDDDIEENEEDIEKNRDTFQRFVSDVIAKL